MNHTYDFDAHSLHWSEFLKIFPESRTRVLEIARRLLDLKEYGPDQALFIAIDIVRNRLHRNSVSTPKSFKKTSKEK